MRIERLQHAVDRTVDHAIGFDRLDVFLLYLLERRGEDVDALGEAILGREDATAEKAANQRRQGDGERRDRDGAVGAHMHVKCYYERRYNLRLEILRSKAFYGPDRHAGDGGHCGHCADHFRPRKLPELGKSLGKSIAEFKRASNELKNTLEDEIRTEELQDARKSAQIPPTASVPPAAPAPVADAPEGETTPRVDAGA